MMQMVVNMPKIFHSDYQSWQRLKEPARQMRHEPTPAEAKMWPLVRNGKIAGFKFRRQYAIGRFVVDFVCLERRLVIEIDGSIHDQQIVEDADRQEYLEEQGFSVVRFTNAEVIQNTTVVRSRILEFPERC